MCCPAAFKAKRGRVTALTGPAAGENQDLLRLQTVLARFGELALKSNDLDEILAEACRLVGEALGTDLSKVCAVAGGRPYPPGPAGVGWKPGVVGRVTLKVEDGTSEGHASARGSRWSRRQSTRRTASSTRHS
jgi:hypothetical protein